MAALFPNPSGTREDLMDIISVVDAKNTPISSSVAKAGPDITNPGIYSYQADGFSAPSTLGVSDSADVTTFADPTESRVLLSARGQKLRRSIQVSDFQANVVDVAGVGRKKEMSRGVARAITELKRDIEATIGSDNPSVEGASGGTAYKTRGLGHWIQTTAQTDLPVPETQRPPSASIITDVTTANLTENDVQGMLQSIYSVTGTTDKMHLVCGPKLKTTITNFTRFATADSTKVTNRNQGDSSLVSNVSFYEGDFSTITILPSLLLASGGSDAVTKVRGYVMSADHLMLRYGRRPRFQSLEDRGGGPRGLIDAIVSLACLTPKAMGKFAGIA